MSKMTDLMDMYLAIRESGASRKDAYTILDMLNNSKTLQTYNELKNITSHGNEELVSELEHKIQTLQNILVKSTSKNLELINEIDGMKKELKQIRKKLEKIQSEFNPKKDLEFLERDIVTLENKMEICPGNIDDIIRKLHVLDRKKQSFRFKKETQEGRIKYDDTLELAI